MTSRSKEIGLFSLIILTLACVFRGLILSDPILERDDQNILAHLHGFLSIRDLLKQGRLSEIIAYQPIRDLSYFLDLAVQKHLGLSSFHFTNFAIWVAISLTVYSLLKTLYRQSPIAMEMTALFALHPIFVDSVGWISARKHLLSCLFILLASRLVIGFQKNGGRKWPTIFAVFTLYFLSVLSQPINVLWPVWAFIYCLCIPLPERRPGLMSISIACIPVLAVGVISNFYYYLKLYPIHTSAQRWLSSPGDYGTPFLAIGRYLFNLAFPVRLALIYYPGSLPNLIGLFGGFLFFAFAFIFTFRRKLEFRQWLPWVIFSLFPLLPVVAKPTNIFVSDTYILVASFGLLNLLILSVGSIWKRSHWIYAGLIIGFVLLSIRQAENWKSDRALWNSSYASEPTPKSLAFHAKYLIEEGRYAEATQEALALEAWDRKEEEFPFLYAKSIYLNTEMNDEQKISTLERRRGTASWIDYFLAGLYAKRGGFSEAFTLMQPRFAAPEIFSGDLPVVAAEANYFCLKARSPEFDCTGFVAQARRSRYWDEKRYTVRLNALMAQSP